MGEKRRAKMRWDLAGLAALAAVTAGVVGFTFLHHEAPTGPVDAKVSELYTHPPTVKAAPTPANLADVKAKLADPSKPWTLAVAGDSTGNADDEWVYLLAKKISAKYGRPIVIHDWSIDTNAYSGHTTVGAGAGQPVQIWNASASGKNFTYSFEHRAVELPEQPDLLIVNHGHNIGTGQEARSGAFQLVDWALNKWPTPPAVAVTLENPRVDASAAKQEQVVEALRQQWAGSKVTLVDVHKAFSDAPNLPALLRDDGFHPNPKGEEVWAEAVWAGLGL